ncbi:MAG TPA: IscS subfamily cysteine desulfurase [Cyclobacteriaceae bacterium]|nr:IscS subfamily cysteine desulfurase [Cyclobacteriaceae bacterium]
MKFPIYLDHNATTPCDSQVLESMIPWFTETFGNASSLHYPLGWLAEEAVETAREQVADLIGANAKEVVFTSGATESINLAIRGLMELSSYKGHIITVTTEHKAILDTCKAMEKKGTEVTYLPVDTEGILDLERLSAAIRSDTILVIVMMGNNETGVLQPLAEVAELAKQHGFLLMSDGVQAVGKIEVAVNEHSIDLMPISAHKMYGPKGVGALYIRSQGRKVDVAAQLTGGGHERGLRSGTLNVPGIVGLGKAAEIAQNQKFTDYQRLSELRNALEKGILGLAGTHVNGHLTQRLPHVSNISFEGVEGKELLIAINKELAVSSGSACSSITTQPSHVLTAMGLNDELARSSIRFGLGRSTTKAQIDFAVEFVKETVNRLRGNKDL